jgi:hypothetical protein
MELIRTAASSALGTYLAYLAYGLTHPTMLWRAKRADAERSLPGDGIVPDAQWRTTVTRIIDAEPADVWPWIVQMGWGRAGYYTWYPYDNGGVPSADRIVPELQTLGIGDVVPDGPRSSEGYGVWRVHTIERPSVLVLVSRRNLITGREIEAGDTGSDSFVDCSWAFVLEELEDHRTKLFVRVRAAFQRTPATTIMSHVARLVFGVGDAVMEQSLLDGLKQRAEAA